MVNGKQQPACCNHRPSNARHFAVIEPAQDIFCQEAEDQTAQRKPADNNPGFQRAGAIPLFQNVRDKWEKPENQSTFSSNQQIKRQCTRLRKMVA